MGTGGEGVDANQSWGCGGVILCWEVEGNWRGEDLMGTFRVGFVLLCVEAEER